MIRSRRDSAITHPVLGTAHLFGLVDAERSLRLLDAAWDAGFRRFDTAPSYGFGASEAAVGRLLAARRDTDTQVTTKVGIAAVAPPGRAGRTAKAVARRLPRRVQDRLRPPRPVQQGQFSVVEVRASVESSLRRLGRIDRLMLHEVRPDEITEELLTQLAAWQRQGDVGLVGVATANEHTSACLARGPDLFRGLHQAAGLFAPRVEIPSWVSTRVGHGALGAGGRDLHTVRSRLAADPELSARWQLAAGSRPGDEMAAVGDVMLARMARRPDLTEVIIATSDARRLPRAVAAVGASDVYPAALFTVLEEISRGQEGPEQDS